MEILMRNGTKETRLDIHTDSRAEGTHSKENVSQKLKDLKDHPAKARKIGLSLDTRG
jgi:hypothetical protein